MPQHVSHVCSPLREEASFTEPRLTGMVKRLGTSTEGAGAGLVLLAASPTTQLGMSLLGTAPVPLISSKPCTACC